MTSKLSFFLIGIFMVIFAIGVYNAYGEIPDREPNFTWGWTESEEYFKIYWMEFGTDERFSCKPNEIACGMTFYHDDKPPVHVIYYMKGLIFTKTLPGCNVWTHENLHHWGYNEGMIRDFFDCNGSKYKTLPKT